MEYLCTADWKNHLYFDKACAAKENKLLLDLLVLLLMDLKLRQDGRGSNRLWADGTGPERRD